MKQPNVAALLHAVAGAASLIVSMFTRAQIGVPEEPIKTIGYIIFALGALLFAYAITHLRAAFRGNVEPVTDHLVMTGPYRVIRHPLYLAMLIMCLGLAIGMRSIWGLGSTLLLFFPLAIYRAKLEEIALQAIFGEEWNRYKHRTRFIIPFVF